MKQCTRCGEAKLDGEFVIRRDTVIPKLRSACRACDGARVKQWQINNRDRRADSRRAANISDPIRTMLASAKHRADRYGREFSITAADICMPDRCPVIGIPIERREGRHAGSPSLDRIDTSRGYVPGNVMVISWRANSLKSDGTIAEFEQLISFMLSHAGALQSASIVPRRPACTCEAGQKAVEGSNGTRKDQPSKSERMA